MTDSQGQLPATSSAHSDNRTLTLIMYGLGLAAIIPPHITGVIAVIIAYVKRSDTRGTVWESHYENQITAFWVWLMLYILGWCTVWVLGLGFLVIAAAFVYYYYRTIRGFIRAVDHQPYV